MGGALGLSQALALSNTVAIRAPDLSRDGRNGQAEYVLLRMLTGLSGLDGVRSRSWSQSIRGTRTLSLL